MPKLQEQARGNVSQKAKQSAGLKYSPLLIECQLQRRIEDDSELVVSPSRLTGSL